MDGREFLAALHKLPGYAAMPAIALTGYGAADGTRHQGLRRFAAALGKPVMLEALAPQPSPV